MHEFCLLFDASIYGIIQLGAVASALFFCLLSIMFVKFVCVAVCGGSYVILYNSSLIWSPAGGPWAVSSLELL